MRRTKWYKENDPGGYIITAKISYLYLNLEHIYLVFMLHILYHFVRLIHAVLTHITLFRTVQKWLRYQQCTMPAHCWLSTYNKNQPFLQKKMCLHLQFTSFCKYIPLLFNLYKSSYKSVKPWWTRGTGAGFSGVVNFQLAPVPVLPVAGLKSLAAVSIIMLFFMDPT
jgi:hypothetical protein